MTEKTKKSPLVVAIRERRWRDARDLILTRPEIVHEGLFTSDVGCIGYMPRGALQALVRQCLKIKSDIWYRSEDEICVRKLPWDLAECHELARLIIETSHCTPRGGGHQWEHANKSILELYDGDGTPLFCLLWAYVYAHHAFDFDLLKIFCDSLLSSESSRKEPAIELPQLLHVLNLPHREGYTTLQAIARPVPCWTDEMTEYIAQACERDIKDNNSSMSQQQLIESYFLTADNCGYNAVHRIFDTRESPKKLGFFLKHGTKEALWHTNCHDESSMDLFFNGSYHRVGTRFNRSAETSVEKAMKAWQLMQGYLKVIEGCDKKVQQFLVHALAATENFPCPWEVFDLALAQHNKEALQTYNDEGLLPLHLALARKLPLVLPLDHAARGEFCIQILERHKAAVGTPTREGSYALHIALEKCSTVFCNPKALDRVPSSSDNSGPQNIVGGHPKQQ